jgi:hypothetical protein
MTMTNDDFLSGGDSLPAFRFGEVGDTVKGQVLGVKKLEDRTPDGTAKTWPNGDPMHVWVFDLDTTGTGTADTALWVRGNMVKAIKQSMVEANLKPSDRPMLTVKHHAVGEPKSKGFSPPKLFKAKCEPGPKATVVADDDF